MSSHPRGRFRGARLRSLLAAVALTAAPVPLAVAAADADAASLPNGRAFELVSPVDTDSQSAWPGGGLRTDPLVIGDGRFGVTQYLTAQFPDAGNGWGSAWVGVRGAGGWTQTSLEPPPDRQDGSNAYELMASAPDASRTLVRGQTFRSIFSDTGGLVRFKAPSTLELRDADGRRTTIAEVPFPRELSMRPRLDVGSTSADLATVTFTSTARILADDVRPNPYSSQVYLWRDGALKVGGVDENGAPMRCGGGAEVQGVSADGSLYYFTAAGQPDANDVCGPMVLYVSDGTRSWPISQSDSGQFDAATPNFVGAAPDGRTAYFTVAAQLVAADTNAGEDLYRATVPAGGGERTLTCISCGSGPGNDAQVPSYGDPRLSLDGSHVWFRTKRPIDGQGEDYSGDFDNSNLFVYHDGVVRLVTATAALPGMGRRSLFQLTPDGRHALFSTATQVLDDVDPQGLPQIYRVGAPAGGGIDVVCVSCGRSGAAPAAGSTVRYTQNVQMSADGATVAFTSRDALTADAVAGLTNLYEWNEGALTLLYTGVTANDVAVMGVSPSGDDIFVDAHGALAPEARQVVDGFYDLRRGGGFPAPPAPPAPCSGSACQGAPAAPPTLPAAATISFDGEGQSEETRDERRAAVRLLRAHVRGAAIRVDVAVPARGRVTIAGARVRAIGRTVRRGGTYRLAVSLTPRARKALARSRGGRLKVALRVGFRPAADRAASTARLTVTVKK